MDYSVATSITDFFNHYAVRTYKAGQILIHAGEDPDGIFHLLSGRVKSYDLSYRGDEVILNIFKPPAFFPVSFAINQLPNHYFYEAEEPVSLHKAPLSDVINFLHCNPAVVYDLLGRVYRGTDGLLERMAHLMASPAKSRVMYELIIECRRFGIQSAAGYTLVATETDLGARAGLSRETVSREIVKMKTEGLIGINHKQLFIPDLARLETQLGHDL
jgi:CRP-like cAMP-binding protein